jgi:hypothetical protein
MVALAGGVEVLEDAVDVGVTGLAVLATVASAFWK